MGEVRAPAYASVTVNGTTWWRSASWRVRWYSPRYDGEDQYVEGIEALILEAHWRQKQSQPC